MSLLKRGIVLFLSLLTLGGCGWKMAENRLRLKGQVLESGTNKPVEGVFIDVADARDKLDFTINTDTVTNGEGKYDVTYSYQYEKWMWVGLPVFWLPSAPETLYIEAFKSGYRRRFSEVDCRGFALCNEKCPPNPIDPILIRRKRKR